MAAWTPELRAQSKRIEAIRKQTSRVVSEAEKDLYNQLTTQAGLDHASAMRAIERVKRNGGLQ